MLRKKTASEMLAICGTFTVDSEDRILSFTAKQANDLEKNMAIDQKDDDGEDDTCLEDDVSNADEPNDAPIPAAEKRRTRRKAHRFVQMDNED